MEFKVTQRLLPEWGKAYFHLAWIAGFWLLSSAAIAGPAVVAERAPIPLPAWQVLEYEQQAFFVTARSRVEVVTDSDDEGLWRLTATSSVASNSEKVDLTLAAQDGRALHRSRLSRGKDQRYKTYEFLPDHLLRVRRDPPAGSALPPCQWPVSSRREIAYPAGASDRVITDAYALLVLAGHFNASAGAGAELVVNTEFNFYRVQMSHSESSPIKVKYQLAGDPGTVSGTRATRGVTLLVSPLGEQPDKPDFSLLGLTGGITILFDEATGLPLQLRGTAPRVGSARIDLKGVTLREPAA